MNTQTERLLNHFNEGKTITAIGAYVELGIARFSARLADVEKRGHVVQRKTIEVKNRFGEVCHVKEYWIDIQECEAA